MNDFVYLGLMITGLAVLSLGICFIFRIVFNVLYPPPKKVVKKETTAEAPDLTPKFKVVEHPKDVHLKTAIIEVQMKDIKRKYLSYVKQELIALTVEANLTKGYLTSPGVIVNKLGQTIVGTNGEYFQNAVKYYVEPIENLIVTHMNNATYSKGHMAHFLDKNGFRFQISSSDIRHIMVRRIIESKETVPTVDITVEPIEGETK